MQTTVRVVLAVAFAITPRLALSQAANKAATYITAAQVQTVNQQPGIDRTIAVVDIGSENFAVGMVHRGKTGAAPASGAQAPPAAETPAEPCGDRSEMTAPAGTPRGLHHESQTEGYLITSGAGTLVTGGRVVNGRKSAPDSDVTKILNGPSCSGAIVGSDVVLKDVKAGDIIIIPAGVPHGWSNIPDHVDYLTFRPSDHVLEAGYVHPSIRK